jgi:hypothetical protein
MLKISSQQNANNIGVRCQVCECWTRGDVFLASDTHPIEQERNQKESAPPPLKRPRFDPNPNTEEENDSEDSFPTEKEIQKVEEGPSSILGLIDRPDALYTKSFIYYLWWKMPHRSFDFKVCSFYYYISKI